MTEHRMLSTPVGTEGVYQACRHSRMLRIIENKFTSWGYLPVLTPVFDYYENYRPLLGRAREERICRFPDREGEPLMLRSDITLFLARQMGIALKSKRSSLPKRVYYADSIVRYQDEEDISSGEFFQVGAELIGWTGREADLEVLMLLHEVLEALRLPEWRLHIGSRAVFNAVLDKCADYSDCGTRAAESAGALLEIRDRDALVSLMEKLGLPNPEARGDLLLFLGSRDEFSERRERLIRACEEGGGSRESADSPGPIRRAVEDLADLAAQMAEAAAMDNVRIDLSEHGGQPYHTGFTVQAYVKGVNTAAASGGRYDELLGAFGRTGRIPAAGFSLLMRKIEPLSRAVSNAAGEADVIRAEGGSFAQRYQDARRKRRGGTPVVLS